MLYLLQVDALEEANLALDHTNLEMQRAMEEAEALREEAEGAAEVATARLSAAEAVHASHTESLHQQVQVGCCRLDCCWTSRCQPAF